VVVLVVGAALIFAAITIAPDAIAVQRRHYWRRWWRADDNDGPFWPGTRIPRRPKRSPRITVNIATRPAANR
jgi:hypothetical protein